MRIFPRMSNDNTWNSSHSIINNPRKPCLSISIRESLKTIAQILIPLMIGTFTIVITLQQHNLGKDNRKKDLEIASQFREQEYKINEQRRKQELELDENRRKQDLTIVDNNHRDTIFNIYIRDLTNVILKNNYNLSRSLLDLIIRPMTLTILRQLDSSRKILLLKFLYESKMLQSHFQETRIDLSDADLNGIQFEQINMHNLSLIGASLINTTFIQTDLTFADFQNADLTDSLFINTTLTNVCFYRTRLIRVQFYQSNFHYTDLSLANLTQSTITNLQLEQTSSYNKAILPNGTESLSQNLISFQNKCLLNNLNIYPKDNIYITKQCYFIILNNNVTMIFYFNLQKFQRLIEREQALLQFYFKASLKHRNDLRIDFSFFHDQYGNDLIDRRLGITVYEMSGISEDSFSQYLISSTYPSNGIYLKIELFLNIGDNLTDFNFNIQHLDYLL